MNTVFKILLIIFILVSPAWSGIDFDGTDDDIQCGTSDILQENVALTISAWINPDVDHSGGILSRRNPSGGNVDFRVNTLEADRSIKFRVFGSTTLTRSSAADSITLGQWQHVLVTWDGSTTAANSHIYVNGVEVASYITTTNGVSLSNTSGGTTTIGSVFDKLILFNGKISEVAYWDIELDASEIANLALSRVKRIPLQIRPASLIAYWPLDDQPDGTSGDGDTFFNLANPGTHNCTGNDGAGNTGLTAKAEEVLSYPSNS